MVCYRGPPRRCGYGKPQRLRASCRRLCGVPRQAPRPRRHGQPPRDRPVGHDAHHQQRQQAHSQRKAHQGRSWHDDSLHRHDPPHRRHGRGRHHEVRYDVGLLEQWQDDRGSGRCGVRLQRERQRERRLLQGRGIGSGRTRRHPQYGRRLYKRPGPDVRA